MGETHYSPEEIKGMLQRYYDLPGMISAEFHAAREAAATLSAESSPAIRKFAEEELHGHMRCAGILATQNRFLHDAFFRMNPTEQQVIKYRFMGPKDPEHRRKGYRRPPWKVIEPLIGISDSRGKQIIRETIRRLSELPVEPITFESFGDHKKEEFS